MLGAWFSPVPIGSFCRNLAEIVDPRRENVRCSLVRFPAPGNCTVQLGRRRTPESGSTILFQCVDWLPRRALRLGIREDRFRYLMAPPVIPAIKRSRKR